MFLTPLTTSEFDAISPELEKLLRDQIAQEQASASQAKDKPNLEADIWSNLPKVDSKIAYKATAVLEGPLKAKVPPSVIRNGGYSSDSEASKDVISKLRAGCSDLQVSAS